MKQQIERYEQDELGIGGLIGDLDFLRSALQSPDDELLQTLGSSLVEMESIYASALYDNVRRLSPQDQIRFDAAVFELMKLIESRLVSYDE